MVFKQAGNRDTITISNGRELYSKILLDINHKPILKPSSKGILWKIKDQLYSGIPINSSR